MFKKSIFLLFSLLIAFCNQSFATDTNDYQKGWEAFSANNRVDARKYFNIAATNQETKADAFLSLSLLDWTENKMDAAFEDFRRFYDISPNPYPYLYSFSALPFMYESDNILPKNKLDFFEKIFQKTL